MPRPFFSRVYFGLRLRNLANRAFGRTDGVKGTKMLDEGASTYKVSGTTLVVAGESSDLEGAFCWL